MASMSRPQDPSAREGIPDDFEFHLEVLSHRGNSRELMGREPAPTLLDRFRGWLAGAK